MELADLHYHFMAHVVSTIYVFFSSTFKKTAIMNISVLSLGKQHICGSTFSGHSNSYH
jgi:hypothetical protein